jgi:hypothetical protein
MKNFLTLTILTAATVAAGIITDVSPAMAQGARFQFEPNKWSNKEGGGKPGRYLNQPQQPMTSVGHGMVPKASSFLGVDPSFLKPVAKPAPPAPVVATNVTPSASWGQPQARIVPKPPAALAATPYNPLFGQAPTKPVIAQVPQQAAPQHVAAPSANKSLNGRMMPRRNSNSHAKTGVAGRLVRPAQPRALSATPTVASYGNNGYKPGSVKPSATFSGEGNVYGQIIRGK